MELELVDRFPISFKSAFRGQHHRHIVLGVRHAGRYGALGLSRRSTLMYKPLTYDSLGTLMADFEEAYAAVGHSVVRVRVGRAVPHDPHSSAPIDWRALVLHPSQFLPEERRRVFDRFARSIRAGTLPSEAVVLRQPERTPNRPGLRLPATLSRVGKDDGEGKNRGESNVVAQTEVPTPTAIHTAHPAEDAAPSDSGAESRGSSASAVASDGLALSRGSTVAASGHDAESVHDCGDAMAPSPHRPAQPRPPSVRRASVVREATLSLFAGSV